MTQFYKSPYINLKRASASDSKNSIQNVSSITEKKRKMKGSVTIEWTYDSDVFILILCLIYLLEIQAIRLTVTSAVQGAVKIAAEDMATILYLM